MRFAVLGAAGQLGRDLTVRLPGEVIPLTRAEIDLSRPKEVRATIASLGVDVFINCAAYNLVDQAETDPESAFAVNAWGVRALAQGCRDARSRFVHFSTDYVFGIDGNRTTPLSESDPPGPVSIYGLSKLAGEYLARAELSDALVIRTCGLYGLWGSGGKGGNFVETMLRLAREGKPVSVVNDQHCTPSYTIDVAEATVALIQQNGSGLYHITNSGSCTWFDLTQELFRLSDLTVNLRPISSREFGRPARRPAYSVLSTEKLAGDGIRAPRHWSEALAAYLAERRTRSL